nr:hypothetical protein [Tanacetum cinerariifolium]
EKMLLCKQDEAGIQLNVEKADWRDDTDDELEDQEPEAYYMYMAQLQEVSSDAVDSGPIFDAEPLQKVSNNDHYNVFAIESEHTEQSESIHDTYPIEQDEQNVIIDSLDMKQKVQHDDHYDVFAIDCRHPEQSESVYNTYLLEQDAQNVSIVSVDINYDSEQIDQNDEDVDLAKERSLLL